MYTPKERFETHKAGGKLSSAVVRKYGRRLRPTLYRAYKRMSLADAEEMEVYVAERLSQQGLRRVAGQGRRRILDERRYPILKPLSRINVVPPFPEERAALPAERIRHFVSIIA